jgi:orotidine-5'-phosphate decarboxylase
MEKIDPKERLIFALDVHTRKEAESYVDKLEGVVDFFKVGIILHTVTGAGFVSDLIKRGKKVFLDLKFFDIADTVREAVRQVSELGIDFLTVHADRQVMNAAVEGKGNDHLKILAVTLLTNISVSDLKKMGIDKSPEEVVLQRAKMALECGCDGVIASGREVSVIKKETGGKLLVVTPGVRPAGASADGQKRFVTPSEAIRAGADYLVVGRPIKNAPDPAKAAEIILEEMKQAYGRMTGKPYG